MNPREGLGEVIERLRRSTVVVRESTRGSGSGVVGLDGQPLYSKEHLEQHVLDFEGQILRLQSVRGDRCHIRSVAVVPRSRRSRAA